MRRAVRDWRGGEVEERRRWKEGEERAEEWRGGERDQENICGLPMCFIRNLIKAL